MRPIALALVHYPVLDRSGATITTAITNIDLHDIARSARTYGLSKFFVVHPIGAQRELAERVREHWIHGSGARRIPDRTAPMQLMEVVSSLEEAFVILGGARFGLEVWTTSARVRDDSLTYERARQAVQQDGPPILLVFGTGWGLAPSVMNDADVHLMPICPRADSGFNHLSVRAACAIVLDRILGDNA